MARGLGGDCASASVRVLGVYRTDVCGILAAGAWADRRYRADYAWLTKLMDRCGLNPKVDSSIIHRNDDFAARPLRLDVAHGFRCFGQREMTIDA